MESIQSVQCSYNEARSTQIRAELKQWEHDFADSHGGRKAGREDIKQHPEIASKYKIYDKLRKSLSNPDQKPPASPIPNPKKRSSSFYETALEKTPSKRAKHAHPLHSHHPTSSFASRPLHPALLDPYDPPQSTHLLPFLSPSRARTSLGPTPQKDGKALGLFDVLSSGSADRTPSKRRILHPIGGNNTNSNGININDPDPTQTTPSKPHSNISTQQALKLLDSASKTQTQNQAPPAVFTPSRPHPAKQTSTPASTTTSTIRKLQFDTTPAFLRRDSQRSAFFPASTGSLASGGPDDEALSDDEGGGVVPRSPIAPRQAHRRPRRPLAIGRGLSALVKGLREMEEARHEEDLDLLREMEGGGIGAAKGSSTAVGQQPSAPKVKGVVVAEMPLGPDRSLESEEDDEGGAEGTTRDGRPRKVWKKKGQKRTTRAVKMRPIVGRWKPEPVWSGGVVAEEEGNGVGETQCVDMNPTIGGFGDGGPTDLSLDNDDDDDDDEYAAHPTDPSSSQPHKQQQTHTSNAKSAEEDGGKPNGNGIAQTLKKKIKTISATAHAHANFRALKIRGKGSKGKGGGRFGRRR